MRTRVGCRYTNHMCMYNFCSIYGLIFDESFMHPFDFIILCKTFLLVLFYAMNWAPTRVDTCKVNIF